MLPGNIFGLILKNKMAATGVFSTFSKDFCWPSRSKGIIGRDLKFAGYVPHYKILTENIFGLILKNKMSATGVFFSTFSKDFCWLSRSKGIIGRDLKFAGYVPHYKILTDNIFGLILKNKMSATAFLCQSRKVLISPLLLVLEVWDGKPTCRKSWAGNLLVWSDLTLDPSFKVKRG